MSKLRDTQLFFKDLLIERVNNSNEFKDYSVNLV